MGVDAILRKYTSFDEMKADEYRYWQSRPVHERMDAVEEMIQTAYALKGWEIEPDVPRLQRPFVRLPCPWNSWPSAIGLRECTKSNRRSFDSAALRSG
jgi:hypothetical protein